MLAEVQSLNDKLCQVLNSSRLWPINSVQRRNVLPVARPLNILLLYEFDIRNLLNLSVLQIYHRSNSACPNVMSSTPP